MSRCPQSFQPAHSKEQPRNVVTGVICERVLLLASNQPPDSTEEASFKITQLKERISRLYFDIMGKAPDMTQHETLKLLQAPEGRNILKAMKVALPPTSEDVMNILDRDHIGAIACSELQEGLLRLRGSSYDPLMLNSHCTVYNTFWFSAEVLRKTSARQKASIREARQALERRIAETLETVSKVPKGPDSMSMEHHLEWTDLTVIRTAMSELQASLKGLQNQCSLHAECQDSLSPSIGTQTDTCFASDSGFRPPSAQSKMPLPLPPLPKLPPALCKGGQRMQTSVSPDQRKCRFSTSRASQVSSGTVHCPAEISMIARCCRDTVSAFPGMGWVLSGELICEHRTLNASVVQRLFPVGRSGKWNPCCEAIACACLCKHCFLAGAIRSVLQTLTKKAG